MVVNNDEAEAEGREDRYAGDHRSDMDEEVVGWEVDLC